MRPECETCPSRVKGLCADLSDQKLAELGELKQPLRQVRPGTPLFEEGGDNGAVFVVRHGWAVASTMHENGRRQILRFIMPGGIAGFETTADGCMPCTVEALTDLTVCPISRHRLTGFCRTSPGTALRLASLLACETIGDWLLLGSLGTCAAAERIARLLLVLYDRVHAAPPGDGAEVALPINQTLIADATGLTSVHVCRTLKEMRTAGLLTFEKGHLHVLDWARFVELAALADPAEHVTRFGEGSVSTGEPKAADDGDRCRMTGGGRPEERRHGAAANADDTPSQARTTARPPSRSFPQAAHGPDPREGAARHA